MADVIRTAKAEAVAGLEQSRRMIQREVLERTCRNWDGWKEYEKQLREDLQYIDDLILKICEMEQAVELGYQQPAGKTE